MLVRIVLLLFIHSFIRLFIHTFVHSFDRSTRRSALIPLQPARSSVPILSLSESFLFKLFKVCIHVFAGLPSFLFPLSGSQIASHLSTHCFSSNGLLLRCILDCERSRNQRQSSEFFYGSGIHEVVSRCFPSSIGFYFVTRVEFELTAPAL